MVKQAANNPIEANEAFLIENRVENEIEEMKFSEEIKEDAIVEEEKQLP